MVIAVVKGLNLTIRRILELYTNLTSTDPNIIFLIRTAPA